VQSWKIALVSLTTLVGAGSWAQQSASPPARVDQALAAYGSLADSVRLPDGRTIHFVCMGKGSPTVILTAGLGDWGVTWSAVQPAMARTTRVCAWDRPGFGLSDAGPQATSSATMTADLAAALSQGHIAGPYVLVGHSLGSYESLLFADGHPGSVAGMVLVDPSVPGQAALMKRVAPAIAEANDAYVKGLVTLIRGCEAQARDPSPPAAGSTSSQCDLPFPPTYPPAILKALKAHALQPAQAGAVTSFYQNVATSGDQVVDPARNYGNMPLVVLTATEAQAAPPGTSAEAVAQTSAFMDAFGLEHDKLAALSTRGINARVPGSSHYIHQIKPQVVIDAVNEVVAEARAAKR
jgi:pimeloyl-ACP methyl ester carboxylesterase